MKEIKNKEVWWIAHNDNDVVHHGKLELGSTVQTGQPNLEEFTNEEVWKARIVELGGELPVEEEEEE